MQRSFHFIQICVPSIDNSREIEVELKLKTHLKIYIYIIYNIWNAKPKCKALGGRLNLFGPNNLNITDITPNLWSWNIVKHHKAIGNDRFSQLFQSHPGIQWNPDLECHFVSFSHRKLTFFEVNHGKPHFPTNPAGSSDFFCRRYLGLMIFQPLLPGKALLTLTTLTGHFEFQTIHFGELIKLKTLTLTHII